jgi:glycosyltransferase involved in cell wall biosynthesis
VHLLSSRQRLGRGKALNQAIKSCLGDVVCYIDADLATDMTYLPEIINAVSKNGYDIAIGSRMMAESNAKRNKKRLMASTVYNKMVRLILCSKVYDHQCGFKAFNKDKIVSLLDDVKDNHWFWDTEVLVRGQRQGYIIKEVPVQWNESGSTKVNILADANDMGRQILRLWWDLLRNGR